MQLFPGMTDSERDAADAVTVDGVSTSWAELSGRADALASEIAGAHSVAIAGTPTLDTVLGVLAGLAAGVPVVPVPADAGILERAHILRDSGAELVLGQPDWDDIAIERVPFPSVGASSSAAPVAVDDDATGLVMYTSGTTGLPKGVVIPRRAIAADLDGLADAWGWSADDTLVHGLPLFHVHGLVLGVLGALRVGSKLVHTGRPTPERYAAAGGTMYFGVPTVWGRVAAAPDHARSLAGARLLVSGSAALPVPVFDALRFLTGRAPVERYGMTET
ncbi:MAG: AMP-binding protein, partial [Ilumatobacteraceae bacterium]